MAHLITAQDNFAFTGDRSKIWHGLGMQIPDGLTATEVFPLVGLDWETELVEPTYSYGGKVFGMPEHRVHVRKDSGANLGIVSEGYKPLDNSDLAKFADHLLGADAASTVSTAGSLRGGKRVFCLIKLPRSFDVVKGDTVDTYFCLANGHGGTASFAGYPTAIRVVCNNTLTLSERDMGRGFRFHHLGNLDEKLQQAKVIMGFAVKEADEFAKKAKALANKDLSQGQIKEFLQLAFVTTFGKSPDSGTQSEAFQRWTERRDTMINDWLERMDNERQTIAGIQGTAWAALNAYTEWSDHDRGGKLLSKKSGGRIHSNLFGISASAKSKVLSAALAIV